MSRFVFVTSELEPAYPGGAGVVVAEVAARLAAAGNRVQVLLGAPGAGQVRDDRFELSVVDLPEPDGSLRWYVERSRLLAEALATLLGEGEPPSLVEFPDFDVPAWWALTHRNELGMENIRIGVRLHGPVEAMGAAMGALPPPLDSLAEMERTVFGMADVVIAPSAALAGWARERYGIEAVRIVVGPPPVPVVSPVRWSPAPAPEFVVYGRLSEVKGSHDALEAVLPLFDDMDGLRVRFIGGDGWSATENRSMVEMLIDRIPDRLRSGVRFEGALPRRRALESMATAWAVIVPSRFETFCAALHEVRRAGLPVIAPEIPAFAGLDEAVGVAKYDGTVRGLEAALRAAADDLERLGRLGAAAAPAVGDPVEAYRGRLPAPRHHQSQAGLATAAVQGVAGLLEPPPPRGAGVARRLLRILPAPLARLAVWVVPRRIKERYRSAASWPAEKERREREREWRRLERRVAAGEFPDVEVPRVSVVIPCFEQGRWVEGAVRSVFEQDFESWEIVLVDDGSTDEETVAVLDRLGEWPRIRLLRQENRGLPGARNAGISAARGEFVVTLDADDELLPEYVSTLLSAIEGDPGAGFAHCWAVLFGDVFGMWATRPFNPFWQRLSNGVLQCVLMRRAAWESAGGYDETMRKGHEDWDMWMRLDAAGWGQVRVPRPLYRYRKHGVSMSVESEADFEEAAGRISARHPALYRRSELERLKAEWYPLLVLLTDGGTRIDGEASAEVVPVDATAGLCAAVTGSRGKYLADVRGRSVAVADLVAAADALEAVPGAASRVVAGIPVWRRWAVVDPGSGPWTLPDGLPAGDLAVGACPDPEWMVDPGVVPEGMTVVRHRPEEAGRIPDWAVR